MRIGWLVMIGASTFGYLVFAHQGHGWGVGAWKDGNVNPQLFGLAKYVYDSIEEIQQYNGAESETSQSIPSNSVKV